MPKVTYTAAQGLVQSAGSGISFDALPTSNVQAKTSALGATGSLPGVYTITAGAAVGFQMPLASSVPGGMFIVRNGDAYANFLTCSLEVAGTKAFVQGGVINTNVGSKLTLQGVAGASVAVVSDGKNFIVLPGSGTLSYSGT